MIAIPGKTTASTISGIIADEMAIGMVNQKTTAVRLIPVIGKGVGEVVVLRIDCSVLKSHVEFIESHGSRLAPNAFQTAIRLST